MFLKNLRRFSWLAVLLLYILFITGFVLVHQLDLLLSIVGNSSGICSLILGTYFLYWGLKEYKADRRRNGQKNPGQVSVRFPSSFTLYDVRIGRSGRTFHNPGFVEPRQTRWDARLFFSNKNIEIGLALLLPCSNFIHYHLDRSLQNAFPPGFWYTPIGLIWSYVYLVITFFFFLVIISAFIYSLRKKNATPENQQGTPPDNINLEQRS